MNAQQKPESDACPTCEGVTPTGLLRKEMEGFHCPTCGHLTPSSPPVVGGAA